MVRVNDVLTCAVLCFAASHCNGRVEVGALASTGGDGSEAGDAGTAALDSGAAISAVAGEDAPAPPESGNDSSLPNSTAQPTGPSGVYRGYVESFKFPDGSDSVALTLSFASDGTVTGTAYFGNALPLAPPTDPAATYPPGYGEMFTGGGGSQVLEGFTFTVLAGTYSAPRLRFQVQPSELWKRWCELQTKIYPYYNGAVSGCGDLLGYSCLPNGSTGGTATGCQVSPCYQSQPIPVDCGKLSLCQSGLGPCTCTATSCTVQVGPNGSIAFDMQVAGSGSIDGSLTGIYEAGPVNSAGHYNVHFTRVGDIDGGAGNGSNQDGSPGASNDSSVSSDVAGQEAAACSVVLAADYDVSCIADSDCVLTGQVPKCPASACDGCATQSLNKVDVARYQLAYLPAIASAPAGQTCNCPCQGIAVCRGGKCQNGGCAPPAVDTLPACVTAGGQCAFMARAKCSSMVSGANCAYADEVCCIP
jgi:hypothetical protein